MNEKAKKYLFDAINSIESIDSFIDSTMDFKSYQNDKLRRRAVERELEIIGEAINHALKIEPALIISDARNIVGLRNWLIHAYDSVDDALVWNVIEKHLPNLRKELGALLLEN
jgi:uncharacterized protein with HEPN domain